MFALIKPMRKFGGVRGFVFTVMKQMRERDRDVLETYYI